MAAFSLWLALGEALRMLGETRGNDGWKEDLYTRVQDILSAEAERSFTGDPSLISPDVISDAARRSGSIAVDTAFDRIRFDNDPGR